MIARRGGWLTQWQPAAAMVGGPQGMGCMSHTELLPLVEQRQLSFSPHLLCLAIAAAGPRALQFGLPGGPPAGVELQPEAQTVTVLYPAEAPAVTLTAPMIAALLLGYVLLARIPLPRRAEKSIRVEAGTVVLTVSLQHEVPPWQPMARPARQSAAKRPEFVWTRE
jgi:hypothetical protein